MSSPSRIPRPWIARNIIAFLACVIACVLLALFEGKDFNWDFRNYHLYGPYALLQGRYGRDFMAAGPQGYVNPVAHLPLYWMIRAEWDDRLIASLLAIVHAISVYSAWKIGDYLFRCKSLCHRHMLAFAASALALLTPVFWGVVGGTFSDPTVASFAISALATLVIASGEGDHRLFALSGALAGLSVGLKLTQVIYAPAFALALVVAIAGRHWIARIAVWCAAGASAFLLSAAPSAIALWREFGNPVFPFFNSIFRAPEFSTLPIGRHLRFVPDDSIEFLLRPVRMLDPRSFIYIENGAPDWRPAALCIVLGLLSMRWFAQRVAHQTTDGTPVSRGEWVLWSFLAAAWPTWLYASGNGRYGLAVLMLIGPTLAVAISRLLGPRAIAVLAVFLSMQTAVVVLSGNHRWTVAPWTGKWFTTELPAAERDEPHGYIVLDVNTNSFIFPSLEGDSAFFALTGQQASPDRPAVKQRLTHFIQRWKSQLRVVGELPRNSTMHDDFTSFVAHANGVLRLYGLRATTDGCATLGATADTVRTVRDTPRSITPTAVQLASCLVEQSDAPELIEEKVQRARMGRLFNRIAQTCRLWFPESGDLPPTPKFRGWQRRYETSDVVLFTRGDDIFLSRYDFGPFDMPLGQISDWEGGKQPVLACAPLARHYLIQGRRSTN